MSFRSAVNALLAPLGFERQGKDWVRRTDGFVETVGLHVTSIGTVIDYQSIDLTTRAILMEVNPTWVKNQPQFIRLFDPTGKQVFRSDTDKPSELARAIHDVVLPFFEKMRTPAGQIEVYKSSVDLGASGYPTFWAVADWRVGDKASADAKLRWGRRHTEEGIAGLKALRVHLGLSEEPAT